MAGGITRRPEQSSSENLRVDWGTEKHRPPLTMNRFIRVELELTHADDTDDTDEEVVQMMTICPADKEKSVTALTIFIVESSTEYLLVS